SPRRSSAGGKPQEATTDPPAAPWGPAGSAAGSPAARRTGSGSTSARQNRSSAESRPDAADDPRPHTDASARGAAEGLTGTDLVMRELGGLVIEDGTDV